MANSFRRLRTRLAVFEPSRRCGTHLAVVDHFSPSSNPSRRRLSPAVVEPVWLEGAAAAPTVVVAAAAAATAVVVTAAAVTVVVVVVIVIAAAAATVVVVVAAAGAAVVVVVTAAEGAAAAVVVVAAAAAGVVLVAEDQCSVGEEKKTKTNHNEGCGSFSGHTAWASHFMGPPFMFLLSNTSIEQQRAAHIPMERGGAGVTWIRRSALLGALVVEPTSLR